MAGPGVSTIPPSFVLRGDNPEARDRAYQGLVADLVMAGEAGAGAGGRRAIVRERADGADGLALVFPAALYGKTPAVKQLERLAGSSSSYRMEPLMIIIGIILLIIGFLTKIAIVWTLGIIALVVGLVLTLLGAVGHAVGPRRHYW